MCRKWPAVWPEAGTSLTKDQTMFIRAYKARRRPLALEKILGMKLEAAARPNPPGSPKFDPDDGAVSPLLSSESESEQSECSKESFNYVPVRFPPVNYTVLRVFQRFERLSTGF